MVLPIGVKKLGSFKGLTGDTGVLADLTVNLLPWDADPYAEMTGPDAYRGARIHIPMPLPGPETVNNDDATELLVQNPTKTSAAIVAKVGHETVEPSNAEDLTVALIESMNSNIPLVLGKGETYILTQDVFIPLAEGKSVHLDLNGATLDFRNNAGIRIAPFASQSPAPHLSTTIPDGVIRGQTSFTVESAAGVKVGDLVIVRSPVIIASGVAMEQTYTVGYVEGNKIYVDGIVVGDVTPAQIVAAGISSGTVEAKFYRMGNRVTVQNGTIASTDKTSNDVLLNIHGVREVTVRNVNFDNPYRNGVNVSWCGLVRVEDSGSSDTGYVKGDQGYASVPSSPDGLSFGYGVISSRCYMVVVKGLHAYRGWHGIDFALGTTYGVAQDCVFHKNAYGVSSHEGSWSTSVIDCQFIGGLGITSRSSELNVEGNRFWVAAGSAIAGVGTHQNLIIKNNTFMLGGVANSGWMAFSGGYPDYVYSATPSYSEVSDNEVLGVSSVATLRVAGSVKVKGNTVRAAIAGPSSVIDIVCVRTGQKRVVLESNTFIGTLGQFNVSVTGVEDLIVHANRRIGDAPSVSNGALVSISGSTPKITAIENHTENVPAIFRTLGAGAFVFDVVARNIAKAGRLIIVSGTVSVSNMLNNAATTATSGVTVAQDVGNVILTP